VKSYCTGRTPAGYAGLAEDDFSFFNVQRNYILISPHPTLSHKGRGKRSWGGGYDTGGSDLSGVKDGRF